LGTWRLSEKFLYQHISEASGNRVGRRPLPTTTADVASELRSQVATLSREVGNHQKTLMRRLVLRLTGPLPETERPRHVDYLDSSISMIAHALTMDQPQEQIIELKVAANSMITQVERLLVDRGRAL